MWKIEIAVNSGGSMSNREQIVDYWMRSEDECGLSVA